ncbi:MAG TPA: hypothetical protein VE860_16640 [Chthoniobacterales bacterium]|jgi:hypothetical protein|nr:hypothetical protein [Chthoniobacterales bacterium]
MDQDQIKNDRRSDITLSAGTKRLPDKGNNDRLSAKDLVYASLQT